MIQHQRGAFNHHQVNEWCAKEGCYYTHAKKFCIKRTQKRRSKVINHFFDTILLNNFQTHDRHSSAASRFYLRLAIVGWLWKNASTSCTPFEIMWLTVKINGMGVPSRKWFVVWWRRSRREKKISFMIHAQHTTPLLCDAAARWMAFKCVTRYDHRSLIPCVSLRWRCSSSGGITAVILD